MTRETKKNILRWVVFGVLILLAHLLQNTAGLFPEPWGARAFLLIPMTVCMGLFERETAGAFLGLFAGLLWDLTSPSHIGFNAIFLMVLGCLCGLLADHLVQNTLLAGILLSGAAVLLYVVLYWLFFLVFAGTHSAVRGLAVFYLPSALYTFLLSPFIYLVLRRIRKPLRYVEE